jgi:hypothetical protein
LLRLHVVSSLVLLLLLLLCMVQENSAASTQQQQQQQQQRPRRRRRRLPSFTDESGFGQSIGQEQISSQGNRPTTQQPDSPSASPPDNNNTDTNDTNTNNDGDSGVPRLNIDPFVVTLRPVTTESLSYQQLQGVRNTVETLLEAYFTETYVWPDETTSVSYVGITQIVDSRPTADNTGVELTLDGLMYFADGSSSLPTEDELLTLIYQEALPDNLLLQAFSLFFPSLEQATVSLLTASTGPPTVSPTVAVVVATPTPSPTLEPTTEAPVTIPSPTTPEEEESPTDAPVQDVPTITTDPPQSSVVIPADPEEPPGEPPVSSIVEQEDEEQKEEPTSSNGNSNAGVLVGCAVGGFVALMLVALLLIHIKRRQIGFGRPYNIKKRPSPLSNDDGNNNNNNNNIIDMMVDNDDLDNIDEERLVEVNVAGVIDFDDMVRSDDDDDDDDDNFVDDNFVDDTVRQSQQQQQRLGTQESWSWKPSAVASTAIGNTVEEGAAPYDDISPAKTASTADFSSEGDVEAGPKTSSSAPPPPPTTKAKSIDEVAAANAAAATTSGLSSYWTSFFHRTNPKNDNNDSENSSNIPPELRSMGSSVDDGDESYLFGDGLLSDLEDGTSTVESFEQRPLQDYIVKKDMLESSATRVAPTNGAALAPPAPFTALEKERRPSPVGSEGNFTTNSEEEEERRKNEVMIPNPYVVRPAYGSSGMTNQVLRSSTCLLEPTDTSAAMLAQRVSIEGNDPIVPHVLPVSSAVTGKQQGMIPKVSPPAKKSWWRASSQQEGKERQASWPTRYSNRPSEAAAAAASAAATVTAAANSSTATATAAANSGSEDDDTFGPALSDGWDPADSEMGSLGTLPNEEDLFQPTVEDKTGQTFLKNSVRNESARSRTVSQQSSPTPKAVAGVMAGSNPRTKRNYYARKDTPDLEPNVQPSAPGFLTYVQDDAGSLCSEESDVLKWDSEQVFL